MYLSSFRLGSCPERLLVLGGGRTRTAVIANAMDAAPPEIRTAGVHRELNALGALGLEVDEVDLRELTPDTVATALQPYNIVWLRGGNVFMLRYALAASGADTELTRRLGDDSIIYAGYSAGPCVLAPTLRGLEAVDDPAAVQGTYHQPPIWDGLGVLDYAIVPHIDSPRHPENRALEQVAEEHRRTGTPHKTLRDGQVLIFDGARTFLCE
jgi:dipeptidase E